MDSTKTTAMNTRRGTLLETQWKPRLTPWPRGVAVLLTGPSTDLCQDRAAEICHTVPDQTQVE